MNTPWYKEGLRFGCTQCGKCCTGEPGYVWVSETEIETIARSLNLSIEQFMRQYTRRVGERIALLEDPRNFDCIFLKGKQCTIYATRPKQCRTFPWWKENLSSPEAWAEAAKSCEGIRDDAPVVAFGKIQENVVQDS